MTQGTLCGGGRPLPRAYDPRVPHPPPALAWAGGSLAAVLVVGLLGPSAAVPPLGRNGNAGTVVVTALLAAAVVAGIAAVLLGLRAGRAPRGAPWLAAAAVTALVAVSPVGNADVLSYAAYGRVGVTRADPYATPPQPSRDPVRQQVEDPWRTTPSVYGPLATLEQIAVARVVGDRPLLLPRALAAVNGLLFWLVGLLLWRRSPCRAVWLWWLNPVLLLVLVGGAHLDAAVALLVLLSCTYGAGGRVAVVAGALSVKATAAWAVLGLFTRRPLAAVLGGLLALGAYALAGPHVLDQAHRAGRYVSTGTPWRPVTSAVEQVLPHDLARTLVVGLAIALALLLWRRLVRLLPQGQQLARAALASSLAWTLLAPYALPWYDATAFALLPLLAASRYDRLLVGHTAVLSIAYLPGRVVPLPGHLQILLDGWKSGVCPVALLAVVLLAARSQPDSGVPAEQDGAVV